MKQLDRKDAEEYIRIHGQHGILAKRMEELKPGLLQALVDGAVSPNDLPCLLVNRPQTRKQPDWKGYARTLLLKLYRKLNNAEAKADADMERAEASWPVKESAALHVVTNPQFDQGALIRAQEAMAWLQDRVG